jgi:3-oxoacyl-[acyl-carrier protein] reductase
MNTLITGASRGIGYELAKFFSKHGAKNIFVLSRDEKKLEALKKECERLNPSVKVFILPYSLEHASNFLLVKKEIEEVTDKIDVVINNAGFLVNKKFEDITSEELEKVFRVNVFAPFLLVQSLMDLLGKKSKSHVVNIGSMGGVQGSAKFAGLSAYSSSKMAIAGLSECLTEEFKDKNISVNCLAIGAVNTEMLKEAFPGYNASTSPEEMAEFIGDFAINGHKFFNGKILPVAVSTP